MNKTQTVTALLVVAVVLASLIMAPKAVAAPLHGAVTIGFDDAMQSQFDYAWPIMQARGIVGTFYAVSNLIGDYDHMSLAELHTLQDAGNEIGSHSVDHVHFEDLNDEQIQYECEVSQQVLRSYGFSADNFAYPYGDTNDPNAEHIDSIASQYYKSGRSAYNDIRILSIPTNMFRLPGFPVETGDSSVVSRAENAIDQAYNENGWIQIYFHNVIPGVYDDDYTISTQDFTTILNYIVAKGMPTITVNQAMGGAAPLSASISPTYVRMEIGASQTFVSSVSGGVSPYTYRWYRNGSFVSGATGSSWAFTPSQTGHYNVYVRVTDNEGTVAYSNTVTDIVVYPTLTASINPASVNMIVGSTQQFTSTATGGLTPYTYRWYYSNNTAITGATSSTLNYKANNTGTYNIYLNITDSLNYRVKSNVATINVYTQPIVLISPVSISMLVGNTQQFTSTVSGGLSPYSYQWYLNGASVPGATSQNWNFTPTSSGSYSVILNVTDSTNFKAKSNTVTDITVYSQLTVSVSPASAKMNYGTSQTFSVSATGGKQPYTYQWYINGTAISGATNNNYIFTPNANGNYNIHVNVTDNLGNQNKSNAAQISVSSIYLIINPEPQTNHTTDQQINFKITVFNQQNQPLETTLTLTITGPKGYSFYDFQPINVSANNAAEYTFTWLVPNIEGTYVVETGLAPAKLTAYDAKWLEINKTPTDNTKTQKPTLESNNLMNTGYGLYATIEIQTLIIALYYVFLKYQSKKLQISSNKWLFYKNLK